MDKKLIEKIQKLLALSESCNENEAHSAMLKAQELLVKHKLSMQEVKEYKTNHISIKEKISKVTFKKAKWKVVLAQVIADNFGCYLYLKTRGNHTIVFFGREEDALICNIVLEYALDCINSVVKKLRSIYIKKGLSTRGIENDFALGFIRGLQDRLEEQKRKNQEWGLVLVKDEDVVKAYNDITFEKEVNTTVGIKRNKNFYSIGYKEGQRFSISNKIASSETTEPEMI